MELILNNNITINIRNCEDCPFCTFEHCGDEFSNEIIYSCHLAGHYLNRSEHSWSWYGFIPSNYIWENCPLR